MRGEHAADKPFHDWVRRRLVEPRPREELRVLGFQGAAQLERARQGIRRGAANRRQPQARQGNPKTLGKGWKPPSDALMPAQERALRKAGPERGLLDPEDLNIRKAAASWFSGRALGKPSGEQTSGPGGVSLLPSSVRKPLRRTLENAGEMARQAVPGTIELAKVGGEDLADLGFASRRYLHLPGAEKERRGDFTFPRSRKLGAAMGGAVAEDVRHPLRNPGYTLIDLLPAAAAIASVPARAGEIGRATSAARAASAERLPAAEEMAQHFERAAAEHRREAAGLSESIHKRARLVDAKTLDGLAHMVRKHPHDPQVLMDAATSTFGHVVGGKPFLGTGQAVKAGLKAAVKRPPPQTFMLHPARTGPALPVPLSESALFRELWQKPRLRSVEKAVQEPGRLAKQAADERTAGKRTRAVVSRARNLSREHLFSPEVTVKRELRAQRAAVRDTLTAPVEAMRAVVGRKGIEPPRFEKLPRKIRGISRHESVAIGLHHHFGDLALEDPQRVVEAVVRKHQQLGEQFGRQAGEFEASAQSIRDGLRSAEQSGNIDEVAGLEAQLKQAENAAREAQAIAARHARVVSDAGGALLPLQQLAHGAARLRLQEADRLVGGLSHARTGLALEHGFLAPDSAVFRNNAVAAYYFDHPLTETVPELVGERLVEHEPTLRRQHDLATLDKEIQRLTEVFNRRAKRMRPRTTAEAEQRLSYLEAEWQHLVDRASKETGGPQLVHPAPKSETLRRNRVNSLIDYFERYQALREGGLSQEEARVEMGRRVDPQRLTGARRRGYAQLVAKGVPERSLLAYLGTPSLRGLKAALREGRRPTLMQEALKEVESRLLETIEKSDHPVAASYGRLRAEIEQLQGALQKRKLGKMSATEQAIFGEQGSFEAAPSFLEAADAGRRIQERFSLEADPGWEGRFRVVDAVSGREVARGFTGEEPALRWLRGQLEAAARGLQSEVTIGREEAVHLLGGKLVPNEPELDAAEHSFGTVPVGTDMRLGAHLSQLKDWRERLQADLIRNGKDPVIEQLIQEVTRRAEIPHFEGATRIPLGPTEGPGLANAFTPPQIGKAGTAPPSLSQDDPAFRHEFTAGQIRYGSITADVAGATAGSYLRVVKAIVRHNEYDRLWAYSSPVRENEWQVPIRDTREIKRVLKERLARGDEGLHLSQEEVDALSDADLEALDRHVHGLDDPHVRRELYGDIPSETPLNRLKIKAPVGTDLSSYGIRWYDRRWAPELGQTTTHPVLQLFDAINNPARMLLLYARGGYILNLPGNIGMQVLTQGWAAPEMYARAFKIRSDYGGDAADQILQHVGEGRARGTFVATGPFAHTNDVLSAFWSRFVDRQSRVSAFLYWAKRHGVDLDNKEQMHSLLYPKSAADYARLEDVRRRANKDLVEFNNMSPTERDVFRRMIFVYPWVSRAFVWSLRFLREHPYKSFGLAQLGREAHKRQLDLIGPLVSYLDKSGYYGLKTKKGISLVGTAPVNTFQTADQAATALAGVVQGSAERGGLQEFGAPAPEFLLALITGRDAQGNKLKGWGRLGGAAGELVTGLPQVQALRRLGLNEPELGPFNPRGKVNKDLPPYQQPVFQHRGLQEALGPLFLSSAWPRVMDQEANSAKVQKEHLASLDPPERAFRRSLNAWEKPLVAGGMLKPGQPIPGELGQIVRLQARRDSAKAKRAQELGVSVQHVTSQQALIADLQLLRELGVIDEATLENRSSVALKLDKETAKKLRTQIGVEFFRTKVTAELRKELRQRGYLD